MIGVVMEWHPQRDAIKIKTYQIPLISIIRPIC